MEITDPAFDRELCKKVDEKKIFALTHNKEGIALIDASEFNEFANMRTRFFSWRTSKKDLTFIKVHWYDPAFGGDKECYDYKEFDSLIYNTIFQKKAVLKIRDLFCEQYPQKEVRYEFPAIMPDIIFSIFQNEIKKKLLFGKAVAIRNKNDEICGVTVSIPPAESDIFHDKLKDVYKIKLKEKYSDEKEEKNQLSQSFSLKKLPLTSFPNTAQVNKILPILDLQKKLPETIEVLLLLLCSIKSITWLYKISESTTGIPENRFMQEFHVFLLDLSFPFPRLKDRKINDRTYCGFHYIYGVNYLSEEKFFKLLDAAIPYPTVFILRLAKNVAYSSSNKKKTKVEYIYQVWSGLKSKTQKGGIKVNRYYHSDWLPESRFALTLQGDNIKDAFNNIHSQIIRLGEK